MPSNQPISFAAALQKRETDKAAVTAQIAERLTAEQALRLEAFHFHADDITGYCTTLTEEGAAWYRPIFQKYGVALRGTESFREMQYLINDLLDSIYNDSAEMAKAVREGKVKGAELQFVAAVLSEDPTAITEAAERLVENGAKGEPT